MSAAPAPDRLFVFFRGQWGVFALATFYSFWLDRLTPRPGLLLLSLSPVLRVSPLLLFPDSLILVPCCYLACSPGHSSVFPAPSGSALPGLSSLATPFVRCATFPPVSCPSPRFSLRPPLSPLPPSWERSICFPSSCCHCLSPPFLAPYITGAILTL